MEFTLYWAVNKEDKITFSNVLGKDTGNTELRIAGESRKNPTKRRHWSRCEGSEGRCLGKEYIMQNSTCTGREAGVRLRGPSSPGRLVRPALTEQGQEKLKRRQRSHL